MNWIDISVYIILGFFIFIGLTRGLVRQVFSVAALVGGIVTGLIFYDVAAEMFIRDNLVNNLYLLDFSFNFFFHLEKRITQNK